MSSHGDPPADADTSAGVWRTVSPVFGARPDWQPAATLRHWPGGLAVLFAIGIAGSVALLFLARAATQAGFEDTLEEQLRASPLVVQFLLVALVAPAIEETAFRLALARRLQPGTLGASGAAGVVYFAFGGGAIAGIAAALFGAAALAAVVLAVAAARRDPDAAADSAAQRWWSSNPRWPVWCSIALFGFVHIGNYEVAWSLAAVAAAPVVVSPQLWLGLLFTIARVRYGWWAGFVLHSCHNVAIWSVFSALNPSPAG